MVEARLTDHNRVFVGAKKIQPILKEIMGKVFRALPSRRQPKAIKVAKVLGNSRSTSPVVTFVI